MSLKRKKYIILKLINFFVLSTYSLFVLHMLNSKKKINISNIKNNFNRKKVDFRFFSENKLLRPVIEGLD